MEISIIFIVAFSLLLTSASKTKTYFKPIPEGRIIGGSIIDISRHPHQVGLRMKSARTPTNAYVHSCGGSIISEHIVLTAAHCVNDIVASQIQIVAGTNQKNGSDGIIVPVKKIIIHEKFNPYIMNNDIALLVVVAPLPINNFTIKAVELTYKKPQQNEIATISGWGFTSWPGIPSPLLREVKVPIISNEHCSGPDGYTNKQITNAMICAGLLNVGGKDACTMDSGGPLLVHGKLAGVVSWGNKCALPRYPGVYTNVCHFLSWIHEKIDEVRKEHLVA